MLESALEEAARANSPGSRRSSAREIATSLASSVELPCVNLDPYEARPLLRELATLAGSRCFPLEIVVTKIG